MNPPAFEFDGSADLAHIERYNARRSMSAATRLRTEIPPMPYEGRIGAPLTWLLANPGYDTSPGYEFNNPPPPAPDWPLQSLAPEYRTGYGKWTWDRLRELREAFGDQHVSKNVLAVQICPWASNKFDASLRLPSRAFARKLVLHQLEIGSQFVLVRSEATWRELVPELERVIVGRTAHALTAHLSRKNLGQHWDMVYRAVAGKTFRMQEAARKKDVLQVRAFAPSDLDSAFRILCTNGWAHRISGTDQLHALVASSQRVVVALMDGQVAGFARAITDNLSNGYLSMVVVDEVYRRRGIGRALVESLIASERNITWLLRAERNGAQEFFSKLGFKSSSGAMERVRRDSEADG
jgi:ribosomal protein S18 acetylase RimI-like enzyme